MPSLAMILVRTHVLLLWRRGDRVQLGATFKPDLLRADHDEADPVCLIRLINSLVGSTALDDELSYLNRPLIPTIQPKRDLAV